MKFGDTELTVKEQHQKWLDDIRETIWYRVKFEMIASNDALLIHWKRTCWVLHMWQQADQRTMSLEPIEIMGGLSRTTHSPFYGIPKIT